MIRRREFSKRDDGVALIEFALVLPLLAILLFGIFSGGQVLDRRASVSQAAREGARYGATLADDQCDAVANPLADCGGRTWAQQVQHVAVSRSNGDATASVTCAALVEGSGNAPTVFAGTAHYSTNGASPCYADGSADDGLRVQVEITVDDEIDAIFVQVPLTISQQSTAKFEQ